MTALPNYNDAQNPWPSWFVAVKDAAVDTAIHDLYAQLDQAPPLRDLAAAGFMQTDTQIQFLLNLSKVEATASADKLGYCFADQKNFDIEVEELAMFTHERFGHIPGCTGTRTNERYALWANKLIREHSETCMQLSLNAKLQG